MLCSGLPATISEKKKTRVALAPREPITLILVSMEFVECLWPTASHSSFRSFLPVCQNQAVKVKRAIWRMCDFGLWMIQSRNEKSSPSASFFNFALPFMKCVLKKMRGSLWCHTGQWYLAQVSDHTLGRGFSYLPPNMGSVQRSITSCREVKVAANRGLQHVVALEIRRHFLGLIYAVYGCT